MEHSFTPTILSILKEDFGKYADEIYRLSNLLQYINRKTRSASSGSKTRAAFANNYAIYVLVEDYVKKDFAQSKLYKEYAGAQFTALLKRQRELPFGTKLQNHALNGRFNDEFRKFFPASEYVPIIRDPATKRYWINENLLIVNTTDASFNISASVLKIIDAYVSVKKDAFESFIGDCVKIQKIDTANPEPYVSFVQSLLRPNVDARIFEIVSYSILKQYYQDQQIFWGLSLDDIRAENLKLYKTGRTNANDGGIDFVMRPLGRFFQVTETLDVRKYFLDIDKIQHYPLSFIIKSDLPTDEIISAIQAQARLNFVADAIVNAYMQAIEEVINIPQLLEMLNVVIVRGAVKSVLDEIILQSKIEFNYFELEVAEDSILSESAQTNS